MKKFLSIFIALLLIVSLFATTAVAFAEESGAASEETTTPTTPNEGEEGEEEPVVERSITIDEDKLMEYLASDTWFNNLKIEMGDVKFGVKLMEKSSNLREVFGDDIKYVMSGDEDYDSKKGDNDKIYVEYCRPSESPKGQENWQNSVNITENIRISSSGWYLFRIVLKDKDSKVLARSTSYISRFAEDTSRPIVALSDTMTKKVESGLTAETKYSIPTSGLTGSSLDEMSSTTVNFKIYKFVNGAWTSEPIYDSVTKEIAEGYKDFVDSEGAITPSKSDISEKPVYKVVYSVTDAYGFTGVASKDDIQKYDASLEFNPEMELKVVAAPVVKNNNVNVWEIVLFCIAGAAAIGIVVLLCIKPKQPAPARATSVAKESETETAEEINTEE